MPLAHLVPCDELYFTSLASDRAPQRHNLGHYLCMRNSAVAYAEGDVYLQHLAKPTYDNTLAVLSSALFMLILTCVYNNLRS